LSPKKYDSSIEHAVWAINIKGKNMKNEIQTLALESYSDDAENFAVAQ